MTHVLQPLDVGPNGPIKKKIANKSHHWHGRNIGQKLNQYTLMKTVAYEAFEEVFSNKEIVKSAFRRTGLYPWNKIKPDLRKLAAGKIYKKNFDHAKIFPFPPGSATASDSTVALAATSAPAPTTAPAPTPAPAPTATDPVTAVAPPPGLDVVPEYPVIGDYAEDVEDVMDNRAVDIVSDVGFSGPGPSLSSSMLSSLPSSESMPREASTSSTATLPTESTSIVDFLLAEQGRKTFAKKQRLLSKYEAVLEDHLPEMFEELYAKAMFDVPHSEYQAWLQLKQQAVGTEKEAFERVLSSRIPKNVAKKKTTRTNDMPKGGARYDPQHEEFYEYFARVEERKKNGKRKVTSTTTSSSSSTAPSSSPTNSDSPPSLVPLPAKRRRRTGPKSHNVDHHIKWIFCICLSPLRFCYLFLLIECQSLFF